MGNGTAGEPDGRPGTPPGQPPRSSPACSTSARRPGSGGTSPPPTPSATSSARPAGWSGTPRTGPSWPRRRRTRPSTRPAWRPAGTSPTGATSRWSSTSPAGPRTWPGQPGPWRPITATSATRCCWSPTGPGRRPAGPSRTWPRDDPHVRVLHLDPAIGFGAAMNLGMGQAVGRVLVWLDPHVEATGDLLGPLLAALAQPGAGLAGGWGVTTTTHARVRGRRRPGGRRHRGLPAGRAPGAGRAGRGRPQGPLLPQRRPRLLASPSAPSGTGRPGWTSPRPGTGTGVSTTPTRGNGTVRPERTTIGSSGAGRAAPISWSGSSGAITGTGNRRAGFGV